MATDAMCTACGEDMRNCKCVDCICEACVNEGCKCRQDEDALIQAASTPSVPNLGALMRQGKKSGLIKPLPAYGG